MLWRHKCVWKSQKYVFLVLSLAPEGSVVTQARRGCLFRNFESISNNLCDFQLTNCRNGAILYAQNYGVFSFFFDFKLPVFAVQLLAFQYIWNAELVYFENCTYYFCDCERISPRNWKPLVSIERYGNVVSESCWLEGKTSTLDGTICYCKNSRITELI